MATMDFTTKPRTLGFVSDELNRLEDGVVGWWVCLYCGQGGGLVRGRGDGWETPVVCFALVDITLLIDGVVFF